MSLLDRFKQHFLRPWHWDMSAWSVTGAVRTDNEDRVAQASLPHGSIAVLADGVGGHNAGEVAAQMVCDHLLGWYAGCALAKNAAALEASLALAVGTLHSTLYERSLQDRELRGMASTVVVAVQQQRQAVLAWVGDSRLYLQRNGRLRQLSEDHSLVQEQLRRGLIGHDELAGHPLANQITSSIGGQAQLKQLGIKTVNLKQGDVLVLLSDGVSDYLSLQQIEALVPQGAEALIAASLEAQSADNCSCVLVEVK